MVIRHSKSCASFSDSYCSQALQMFSLCFMWGEQKDLVPQETALTKVIKIGKKTRKDLLRSFKICLFLILLNFLLKTDKKLKRLMRRILASIAKMLMMLIFMMMQEGIGGLKFRKKERRK